MNQPNHERPQRDEGDSPSLERSIDEICDRFARAWQGGQRPRLEDYLLHGAHDAQLSLLRALLNIELEHQQQQGTLPILSAYLERFPEHREQVHAAFDNRHTETWTLDSTTNGSRPTTGESTTDPPALGRYLVKSVLGSGGFGKVYLGYDAELQRSVAIKVPQLHRLRSDAAIDAYLREARLAALLDHPHIVPVYDFGRTPSGGCYIVSKYIDGKDLARRQAEQRFPQRQILELVANVAETLHYAHTRGLVHRDVKPGNILLDKEDHPHLVDFGLAWQQQDELQEHAIAGTPAYMSPEQAQGAVHSIDGRSDIFSLGIVLYQLLTSRLPFVGPNVQETLQRICRSEARPLRQFRSDIPMELEQICLRALRKPLAERYATAYDLARDLRCLADQLSARHDIGGDHRARRSRPQRSTSTRRDRSSNRASPRSHLQRGRITFTPFLREKLRYFCGREWLFEEIERWRREARAERALLITGDPGTGKSTIVAALVMNDDRQQVLAHHCCQADVPLTLESWRFVRNLAAQLAERLPSYAEQCEEPATRQMLTEDACKEDPISAFELGVLAPLQLVPLPAAEACYLIIDALDEALTATRGPNLVELLAPRLERFPDWLRLVATTRKQPQVLEQLQGLRAREIEAQDVRNLGDLRLYLQQRLQGTDWDAHLARARRTRTQLCDQLLDMSAGNFLYLKQALDGLERDLFDVEHVAQLPPGLSGLYQSAFSRLFPTAESFEPAARVLEAVAAAREPFDDQQLAEVSGLARHDLFAVLDRLAPYLPLRRDLEGRRTYAVFHKSLADWLTDSQRSDKPYYVSMAAGHQRLAEVGQRQCGEGFSHVSLYYRRYLPLHLHVAERWDELARLLMCWDFLQWRVDAGMTFELLEDLLRAADRMPRSHCAHGTVRRIAEALAREAHHVARHPTALLQCLWNHCWWYDAPGAEAHYEHRAGMDPPRAPASGQLAMHQWAELWRQRAGQQPHAWLRSLRPPVTPLGAAQRILLRGHEDIVWHVAVSADDRYIASAGKDHSVLVWNAENGREILRLRELPFVPRALLFSPTGRELIAVTRFSIQIWDLATGRRLQEAQVSGGVQAAAMSADGTLLALGCLTGQLVLWDLASGHERCRTQVADTEVSAVDFARDGAHVYFGLRSGEVGRWACSQPESVTRWAGHARDEPRLRDVDGRILGSEYIAHDARVNALAVSPNGRWLASGGSDDAVRLWDLEQLAPLQTLRDEVPVLGVTWSHDGERLAVSYDDGRVIEWLWQQGRLHTSWRAHDRPVTALRRFHHAPRLVTASADWTLRIWEPESLQPSTPLLGHDRAVSCLAFARHAPLLASGGHDAQLRLWNTETGLPARRLDGHTGSIHCIAFAPDERYIASGSSDHTVRVWDCESGRALRCRGPLLGTIENLGFSADGQRLVVKTSKLLSIWELASERELLHVQLRTSAALSADGSLLAQATPEGRVNVLLESGERKLQLPGHDGPITAIAWSDDGWRLASVSHDGRLRVWDVSQGALCWENRLSRRSGECVAFSSDGTLVAAAGTNGLIRIWNVADGRLVGRLIGHRQWVYLVAFARDGQRLFSCSGDKTLRVWDLASQTCQEVVTLARGSFESQEIELRDAPSQDVEASRFVMEVAPGRLETVVENRRSKTPVAWYPGALGHITRHPDKPLWAAAAGKHVVLLTLVVP